VIVLDKKVTFGTVLISFPATFIVVNLFAKAEAKGLKVQRFVTKPFDDSGEVKITAIKHSDYNHF
jgi:hypothetical protein